MIDVTPAVSSDLSMIAIMNFIDEIEKDENVKRVREVTQQILQEKSPEGPLPIRAYQISVGPQCLIPASEIAQHINRSNSGLFLHVSLDFDRHDTSWEIRNEFGRIRMRAMDYGTTIGYPAQPAPYSNRSVTSSTTPTGQSIAKIANR